MDFHPDPPPDGDFARYIEQLNARSAAAARARQSAPGPQPGNTPELGKKAASPSVPSRLSLWTVVKGLVIVWVVAQLIAMLLPRAGVFSIPLTVGLAAWLAFKFKTTWWTLLRGRLRDLADQASPELKQRK